MKLLCPFLIALCGLPAAAGALTAEDIRADLEVVRHDYLPKDMAFTPATRQQAEALLDSLSARAGELDAAQLAVGLAQVGALTDNAHSGLRLRDASVKPASRLPLHLLWMPDALLVARATEPYAELAAARVLKVEGRSPLALYDGAKVLLGGSDAGRQIWLNDWLEAGGILHALGLAAAPDRVSLTLRLQDGRVVERTLPMVPVSELPPGVSAERLWSPDPGKDERGWVAALGRQDVPLYLQEGNRFFRSVELPKEHALYVQFRSNEDEEGAPIADFLKGVKQDIARVSPTHLVVDLRFDIGGNILTTLDFMRGLSHTVPGRTYVLVGRYTFSAGLISAAAIKHGGGARVTLVGEEAGDRMHFWSEGDLIRLPHTRYDFRYTDGQFNLRDGCHGEPRCMDDLYPVNVNEPLDPDIRAPLTAQAYLAKRDPGLEAVQRDLHRRRP